MTVVELFAKYSIWEQIGQTLLMTLIPTLIAYLFGVPLGVWCVTSAKDGIRPSRTANRILGAVINLGRSIPFIILLCMLVPFTRWLVGTSLGAAAAMVPLTLSCIPFVARMTEQSICEIDKGVVEAARCMGANDLQIVTKVYLVEAFPSIVRGSAITIISLIGYTAMAGAVGAGGLGYLAINHGYERNNMSLMYLCVALIILLVTVFQLLLEFVAKKLDKR